MSGSDLDGLSVTGCVLAAILFVVIAVVAYGIVGAAIYGVSRFALTPLLHLPTLSFWQAGLVALGLMIVVAGHRAWRK